MPRLTALDEESKKMQYGMWLGLPREARPSDEKTQKGIAKKLGIGIDTASRWNKDPFVEKVADNALKIFGERDKIQIIESLIKEAKDGKVEAIKLYLIWQGELDKSTTGRIPAEITVKRVER